MRTFEVIIDETLFTIAPEQALMALKGVTAVRATDQDWKNSLHLPGQPLSDAQLEELAEDMEKDLLNAANFITTNQLKTDLDKKFRNLV